MRRPLIGEMDLRAKLLVVRPVDTGSEVPVERSSELAKQVSAAHGHRHKGIIYSISLPATSLKLPEAL